jgi:hypothetical protein
MFQKLTEHNIALESKVNAINERMSKLEQANLELEKKLENASKLKDSGQEKGKTDQLVTPQRNKDKSPEKKSKKKPKDRVEV